MENSWLYYRRTAWRYARTKTSQSSLTLYLSTWFDSRSVNPVTKPCAARTHCVEKDWWKVDRAWFPITRFSSCKNRKGIGIHKAYSWYGLVLKKTQFWWILIQDDWNICDVQMSCLRIVIFLHSLKDCLHCPHSFVIHTCNMVECYH